MPPARTHHDQRPPRQAVPRAARQQNTACQLCRERRVKCDRKTTTGLTDAERVCSECRKRDFPCVDTLREENPTKATRKGRKILEIERKLADHTRLASSAPVHPNLDIEYFAPPAPTAIPELDLSFFESSFFTRFHVQRPIIDPGEFVTRYKQYKLQNIPIGIYGDLIAKVLATWAASYGVNEKGEPDEHLGFDNVERRRQATNVMVRELLTSIDRLAVLRSTTWDGVRVLLLLLPLTEEVQPEIDRATMYQATLHQVYSLSSMGDLPAYRTIGGPVNPMVRARIFWYGHVHEGLTNGLKGRKLIFDQDDVDAFRRQTEGLGSARALTPTNLSNSYTFRYATAPLRLSAVCRQINNVLTGPRAERRQTVDAPGLHRAWDSLAESWEEFEQLRQIPVDARVMKPEDCDRFVSGWQIFIYEAYNVIREKLRERVTKRRGPPGSASAYILDPDDPTQTPSDDEITSSLQRLHDIAESRCHDVARDVMALVKKHVEGPFFEYDASLCRDGVFYACARLARSGGLDNDLDVCLRAFEQMRWAYSKGRERSEKLRAIWQERHHLRGTQNVPRPPTVEDVAGLGPSAMPLPVPDFFDQEQFVEVYQDAVSHLEGTSPLNAEGSNPIRLSASTWHGSSLVAGDRSPNTLLPDVAPQALSQSQLFGPNIKSDGSPPQPPYGPPFISSGKPMSTRQSSTSSLSTLTGLGSVPLSGHPGPARRTHTHFTSAEALSMPPSYGGLPTPINTSFNSSGMLYGVRTQPSPSPLNPHTNTASSPEVLKYNHRGPGLSAIDPSAFGPLDDGNYHDPTYSTFYAGHGTPPPRSAPATVTSFAEAYPDILDANGVPKAHAVNDPAHHFPPKNLVHQSPGLHVYDISSPLPLPYPHQDHDDYSRPTRHLSISQPSQSSHRQQYTNSHSSSRLAVNPANTNESTQPSVVGSRSYNASYPPSTLDMHLGVLPPIDTGSSPTTPYTEGVGPGSVSYFNNTSQY